MSAVLPVPAWLGTRPAPVGLGLDSRRARWAMVDALHAGGIHDQQVLEVMAEVPRHLFVEAALVSRAYQDVSLPIGHGQTISKPSIVARMIELAVARLPESDRRYSRVLEVGSGCGYQTVVLSRLFGEVVSIERLHSLHLQARRNLQRCAARGVRLVFGDGHAGLANSAPFHAIVVAAAFDGDIPEALLHLLRVGGRLVAPVRQGRGQRLCLVERSSPTDWHLSQLDAVRFVPMLAGTR